MAACVAAKEEEEEEEIYERILSNAKKGWKGRQTAQSAGWHNDLNIHIAACELEQ